MLSFCLFLLISFTFSQRFVSYINKPWGSATDTELLRTWGVPGYSADHMYNVINFAFWTKKSGCVDACAPWLQLTTKLLSGTKLALTGNSSPTNEELQLAIMQLYHNAGIKVLISTFGATDDDVTAEDPEDLANTIANFVINNNFDGVDLDWEESHYLGGGTGEEWLVDITTELRNLLPSPTYIITHAPQAPYFTGATNYAYGGYLYVHQQVGNLIDWYNMQYYNQGNTNYESYNALFVDSSTPSNSWSLNSAVFQIISGDNSFGISVPQDMIVVGKPVLATDAYNTGLISAANFASYCAQAIADTNYNWNAGIMTWQFYSDQNTNNFEFSDTVIGVFGSYAPTPQTSAPVPTTAEPTEFTPSPVIASDNVYIEIDGGSGVWFVSGWVREGDCNGFGSGDPSFVSFIDKLEMKSSNPLDTSWYDMSVTTWDADKWAHSSMSQQATTPLSIRLTEKGSGTVSTFNNLITSLSGCYAMPLTPSAPSPTGNPVMNAPDPTGFPSANPRPSPTGFPSNNPFKSPTGDPVQSPTNHPIPANVPAPTDHPSNNPRPSPTNDPVLSPTSNPVSSSNCNALYVDTTASNFYYNGFYLRVDSCGGSNYGFSQVEVRSQSGENIWIVATDSGGGLYQGYPNSIPYTYPLDLRLTHGNDVYTLEGIIADNSDDCYTAYVGCSGGSTNDPITSATNDPVPSPTGNPITNSVPDPTDHPVSSPTDNPVSSSNGDWIEGRSTFYDTSLATGACGYESTYTYVAAVNTAFYDSMTACGECYEVECLDDWDSQTPNCCNNGNSVIVQITDLCPVETNQQWCSGDTAHFDLGTNAFSLIGDTDCGVIKMQYRRVNCPFNGNIKLRNHVDSQEFWHAFWIEDISGCGSLNKVEIKLSGSNTWEECNRQASGWIPTSTYPFSYPVSVRLTDSAGSVITGNDVITGYTGGTVFDFGSNFGNCADLDTGSGTTTTNAPEPSSNPIQSNNPDPTDHPVKDPTDHPFPSPTNNPVPSASSNLYLEMATGGNWYISLYIKEGTCNTQHSNDPNYKDNISVLQIKSEQSNDDSWQDVTKQSWGPFTLSPGNKLIYPLSLRIVFTDSSEITANYIIRSEDSGECYDITGSGDYGSARISNNNSSSDVGLVVGTVVGVLLGLVIIGGIGFYLWRRSNKPDRVVRVSTNLEMENNLNVPGPLENNTAGGTTKGEYQQNNIVAVEEEDSE